MYMLPNQLDTLSYKYTDYEFNLGAKICISSASSVFKSEVNQVAQFALEMLIPNAKKMIYSRKMRITE